MSKLFVIGNGFDQAHGLPTSYEHFHKFLHSEYPKADKVHACVPMLSVGHHGEEFYDDNEVVGYLMNLLSRTEGDYWSDLEDSLGRLDFDDDFYFLKEETDEDGDSNPTHEYYNNEDQASALAGCVPGISRYFDEWVRTISISSAKAKSKFSALIDPLHDHFLSFNYTRTLEDIYGVGAVCHIHGVQGQPLLFGHSAGHLYDEDHGSEYFGSENGLEEIQTALRKDTAGAIEEHQAFFLALRGDITDIYSYGFSLGKVDRIYLKEIFKHVDTSGVVWHLHLYDKDKHVAQKDILTDCGFQGAFGVFDA